MFKTVASNLYLGANNPGIKEGIATIEKAGIFSDVPFVKVPEVLLGTKDENPKMLYYTDVYNHLKKLAALYEEIPEKKLLVGGDHAIGIVTAGHSLNENDNLGVVWVDAHADINTDDITNSGHIHGMPVAALFGLGDKALANFVKKGRQLKPENLVYIGLRDVEPEEQKLLDEMNILHYPYEKVVNMGLENVLKEINDHFAKNNVTKIHVSYDLDSADPTLVPGVTTPVPGGFNLSETKEILNNFYDHYEVVNMDIVEFNPQNDQEDKNLNFFKEIYQNVRI